MSEPKTPELEDDGLGTPVQPDGWTVAQLGSHGLILTCDELQIRLSRANAEKFFDIIEADGLDNVQTDDGFWIEVDADAEDGDVIIKPLHKPGSKTPNHYPGGVVLDTETLADIGVVIDEIESEEEPEVEEPAEAPKVEEPTEEDSEKVKEEVPVDDEDDPDPLKEGVKMAYRRSGKKVKRGFRVTSGIRKGRVVADIKTAHKPRAPAATRMKLRLARKKKKVIRVLKAKRTRRKSLSKRLKRMNAR